MNPNIPIVNVSISDKGEKRDSEMAEGSKDIDDGTYFSNLLDQIDRENSSQRWVLQASLQHQQKGGTQSRQCCSRGTKRTATSTSTTQTQQENLNMIWHVLVTLIYQL